MLWYNLIDRKPIATKTGPWDGVRSEPILVATKRGSIHIALMYEEVVNGERIQMFYDDRDYELDAVYLWAELDSPF